MSTPLGRALGDVVRVFERAPGLARSLSPEIARLLVDAERVEPLAAVAALDELDFLLRRSRLRIELVAPLDAARSALAPALARIAVECEPPLGPLPRDLDWARGREIKITHVPWPAVAGTVVALERRRFADHAANVPHVHLASGAPRTTRLDVLEAALIAIEAAAPTREDHAQLLRLIDDSERDDPRANSEASVRFAVGCIERARAIPKAREVALAFLAGAGIAPIALVAGDRFDPERHPASAFERKLVRGPAGRVVATETTGFKDASGVVLSRAVVSVGE